MNKRKLTLVPEVSYSFNYSDLIVTLDSCCNLSIENDGKTITDYNQTIYRSQGKADSCMLHDMPCILTSSYVHKYNKRFGFNAKLMFADFLIKDERTIVSLNGPTKWILKKLND
jgi:hypothetical protein